MKTDQTKCKGLSDLIFTGDLKSSNEDNGTTSVLEVEIKKIEKGDVNLSGIKQFETGCWVGDDLSVVLGDVKKSKGPKFRFYLKKSLKGSSGFKIIQYEILK